MVHEKKNFVDVTYGLTFESPTPEPVEIPNEEIEDLKERLRTLKAIFLPFLEELSKNPDKPIINWPNRKPILDQQIKQLKELTKV